MNAPECPQGHGPMARRENHTPMAAWLGEWWDCAPGPAGETCRSAVLFPSPELATTLERATAKAAGKDTR